MLGSSFVEKVSFFLETPGIPADGGGDSGFNPKELLGRDCADLPSARASLVDARGGNLQRRINPIGSLAGLSRVPHNHNLLHRPKPVRSTPGHCFARGNPFCASCRMRVFALQQTLPPAARI